MLSLESIWYGQMSVIEYFILRLTKQSCFSFTVSFQLCKCMPLAPIFFSPPSITSLAWTLSSCFFSPSHDCQFPICLQDQKVKVLQSFVNSCIFCLSKRSLTRDFISTFFFFFSSSLFLLAAPHGPSLNSLNFLFLLCLQQDLHLDLLPSQKEVLFFRQGGPQNLLSINDLQFRNKCVFYFPF